MQYGREFLGVGEATGFHQIRQKHIDFIVVDFDASQFSSQRCKGVRVDDRLGLAGCEAALSGKGGSVSALGDGRDRLANSPPTCW